MKKLQYWLLLLFFALAIASCYDIFDPEDIEQKLYITIEVSENGVPVGSIAPLLIVATVDQDASGKSCNFEATGGYFSEPGVLNASSIINYEGNAYTYWYSGSTPGNVMIKASIEELSIIDTIIVEPIPEIEFLDLPDSAKVDSTFLLTIKVPDIWHSKIMEIKSLSGILRPANPVNDEVQSGSKVLPITDNSGQVIIQYTAGANAGKDIITASMLGTLAVEELIIFD